MGFYLHQDSDIFVMISVLMRLWLREESTSLPAFHYRGIIFIGREYIFRTQLEGVLDHFEQ